MPVTDNPKPMRLLLAARKSNKVRGTDRDAITIEKQDKRGKEWAEREGHTVVDVAADVKSGTVAPWDRPNLRPWVTDPARMTLYDGILAYRNDRLSRGDWADEARIRLWAEEHGKVLLIVDGPQWPPRHAGDKWAWEAMADQARREWEAIRERNVETQDELRAKGALTGRAAFGYEIAGPKYGKTLVPTVEGRRLVPEIYAQLVAGKSLQQVADWLSGQTGRQWWAKVVLQLVRNPLYKGRRCAQDPQTGRYGRTLLEVEPLVDALTWRRANDALDARPGKGPRLPHRALLAGLLTCQGCGGPMYRVMTGRRDRQQRTAYYRCHGKGPARKGCGTMVRGELADRAVSWVLEHVLADLPIMKRGTVPEDGRRARLEEIRSEMGQLGSLDLDDEQYDRRLAELRAERDELRSQPASGAPEWVPTGWTYGEWWACELTGDEQRAEWLRHQGFRAWASREAVRVAMLRGGPMVKVDVDLTGLRAAEVAA